MDWHAPKHMPSFGVAVACLVECQTEDAGAIGIVLTTRATARTHAAIFGSTVSTGVKLTH